MSKYHLWILQFVEVNEVPVKVLDLMKDVRKKTGHLDMKRNDLVSALLLSGYELFNINKVLHVRAK